MKRYMKISVPLIAVALLAVVGISCVKVGPVSINDISVVRVIPQDFSTITGILSVEMNNEGDAFDVSSAGATVYLDDTEFCTLDFQPFSVAGDTTSRVDVHPTARLSEKISMFQFMSLMQNHDISRFKVSYTVSAKIGLIHRKKSENKVPLSKFLRQ